MKKYLPLVLCGMSLLGCNQIPSEMQMIKKENVFAPRYFNLEDAVEANKLLIDFPDKIPGAKSVNKYLIPEAKYCIVHIKQWHLREDLNMKEGHIKWIKNIQDNVYNALSFMAENCNVKEVYSEGVTPDFEGMVNLCAKMHYRLNNSEINPDFIKDIPSKASDLEEIKRESPNVYECYMDLEKKIKYDAVYRLASEGKLKILSSEDYYTIKKAEEIDSKARGLGSYRWIFDKKNIIDTILENREDVFLDIASKQENPLAVVVYGAGHAWGGKKSCGKSYDFKGRNSIKDNIAEWNLKHPNKKFSLIEIEPLGL